MKTTFLLFVFPVLIWAQDPGLQIFFENGDWEGRVFIDSSNNENIWQIGPPAKPIFSSAWSPPNAIVTDTAAHYPVNTSSSFVIPYKLSYADQPSGAHTLGLTFLYKIDADTDNDYGEVLMSLDGGDTWSSYFDYEFLSQYWTEMPNGPINNGSPPPLTGSSSVWIYYYSVAWTIPDYYPDADTILLKFVFHSDSVETFQDGWLIDDIVIEEALESVFDISKPRILSKVFPNPAAGEAAIFIEDAEGKEYTLEIFNQGSMTQVFRTSVFGGHTLLALNELPSGAYVYQLFNKEGRFDGAGRFLIVR